MRLTPAGCPEICICAPAHTRVFHSHSAPCRCTRLSKSSLTLSISSACNAKKQQLAQLRRMTTCCAPQAPGSSAACWVQAQAHWYTRATCGKGAGSLLNASSMAQDLHSMREDDGHAGACRHERPPTQPKCPHVNVFDLAAAVVCSPGSCQRS